VTECLLTARGLCAGYHGHPLVEGLDLELRSGQVVALLGPNGAGKTTTLLTLSGELPPLAGTVSMLGKVTTSPLHVRARAGLAFVTEERAVFMELSVRENLRVGRGDVAEALALFPELEPLLDRRTGLLSGGEQQMLALGRALSRAPRILMIDELSLGLAPLVVERLLRAVRTAADRTGVGVLLVEQQLDRAMRVADHLHVLRRGRVVLAGPASKLAAQVRQIEASYFESASRDVPENGHLGSIRGDT
jgi:branched-chain amino acid transport system ATP-binding protein